MDLIITGELHLSALGEKQTRRVNENITTLTHHNFSLVNLCRNFCFSML